MSVTTAEMNDLKFRAETLVARASRLQEKCLLNPGYTSHLMGDFVLMFTDITLEGTSYREALGHLFDYENEIVAFSKEFRQATQYEREHIQCCHPDMKFNA